MSVSTTTPTPTSTPKSTSMSTEKSKPTKKKKEKIASVPAPLGEYYTPFEVCNILYQHQMDPALDKPAAMRLVLDNKFVPVGRSQLYKIFKQFREGKITEVRQWGRKGRKVQVEVVSWGTCLECMWGRANATNANANVIVWQHLWTLKSDARRLLTNALVENNKLWIFYSSTADGLHIIQTHIEHRTFRIIYREYYIFTFTSRDVKVFPAAGKATSVFQFYVNPSSKVQNQQILKNG